MYTKCVLCTFRASEQISFLQVSYSLPEGANSAPPNTLAGFERPLRGVERKGKQKEGRGKKEGKGTGTPPPSQKEIVGYGHYTSDTSAVDGGCYRRVWTMT